MYQSNINPAKLPIIFYVTSGPGCSTTLSSFVENGPFLLQTNGDSQLVLNPNSLHTNANIVYIDHPVGNGFSYSDSKSDDIKNMTHHQSMLNLYEFIVKFLDLYQDLNRNDVYINGSHYNAWIAPLTAEYIYEMNQITQNKIYLKGIAIGDGFLNPYFQLKSIEKYSAKNKLQFDEFLLGLLKSYDSKVYHTLLQCEENNDNYSCNLMTLVFNSVINSVTLSKGNPYNITKECENVPLCYDFKYLAKFMEEYKQNLHISADTQFNSCLNRNTLSYLWWPQIGPWIQDVGQSLITLLEKDIKVLLYYGENDYYFNYIGGLDTITALKWNGNKEFKSRKLENVYDRNNKIVAKMKEYKNLKFYVIKDSGMYVGLDNPDALYYIISNYIK